VKTLAAALCGLSLLLAIWSAVLAPIASLAVVIPSLVILFIIAIPAIVTCSIDAFSPWAYLLYFVFLDVFIRSLYIANDAPSADVIGEIFLLGRDKSFLLLPGLVMIVGSIFLVMGYLSGNNARGEGGKLDPSRDEWNSRRFGLVIALLMVLSWVGIYSFVRATLGDLGALLAENLSSYRGVSDDLAEYRAHGYLRALAGLSDLAFYLALTAILTSRRKPKALVLSCILAFLTSAMFYFFTQSRGGLVLLIINAVALRYYLRGRRVPYKILVVAVPISVASILLLTGLRQGSGYTLESIASLSPTRVVEPLIVNNGGIDVSKTGHIMKYVGPDLRLSYGSTYGWLFVAWIPRQYWPTKPVNIDTTIGMKIYDAVSYGTGAVPPGFFGELFLNFWYFGIPIGCWLLGRFIRFLHARFIQQTVGRNAILVYVVCFMSTGIAVLGSGFASFTAGLLLQLVPLIAILRYVRVPAGSLEPAPHAP
jgi:oligosaccharide repeat unit polymerase